MANEIQERYFDWMYSRVMGEDRRYSKLLRRLNEIPFTYILPMDENRMDDGFDLRYRFGHECGYDDRDIANRLDISDCSVLEMMVALAIRCEEGLMDDPDLGDRTSMWFRDMIENLGLTGMDDRRYNQQYVDAHIDIFLRRRYAPDGEGGLFRLKHATEDMRNVQIWYQMSWYLNEINDK